MIPSGAEVDAPTSDDDPVLVRVANKFIKPKGRPRSEIAASLICKSNEKTVENLLEAVRIYTRAKKEKRKDGLVMNAIMEVLNGNARHRFAIRVIGNDVLGRGRLDAVTRLEYYLVSPLVLIEDLYNRPDGDAVKTIARMFRKEAVVEVVKLVLENFDNVEVIVGRMKEKEELAKADFDGMRRKWKPVAIRKFVERVCTAIGEPFPIVESRRLLQAIALGPVVDSFLQNQLEDMDAFPLLERISALDDENVAATIDFLCERSRTLASFVSERIGRGVIIDPKPHVTSCLRPFNGKLHELPCDDGVILKTAGDVEVFKKRLEKARFLSLVFHAVDKTEGDGERVGLVTIYLRGSATFFLPHLFPALVKPLAKSLRESDKLTLTYCWPRWEKACALLFRWVPSSLIDARDVAAENDLPGGFDVMTESVVGGHFCRRASNFGDSVIPSAAARRHQAIRAALVYEFVAKMRKLRGQSGQRHGAAEPTRNRPGGCRSGSGGGSERLVWLEPIEENPVSKHRRV